MSPYAGLSPRSYWKTGVFQVASLESSGIYQKKLEIGPQTKIATAGSCFAQHIAEHLRKNGFSVLDLEHPPLGIGRDLAKSYGYRLYSARYGNIYTVRQLLQLAQEALGRFEPAEAVWERDGRYFDALRPSVEPEGLDSPEEVRLHRQQHLKKVKLLLRRADLFIFTLGLTEAWVHRQSGTVYPTAPGTVAGTFNEEVFGFRNFRFAEIVQDFQAFRALVRRLNPKIKFLLTVSPVPLTATAGGQHVWPATVYSKSVLRAAAGQLYESFEDIDYFPSYEIIATPFSRQTYYEENLRSVSKSGVEAVMRVFFHEHGSCAAAPESLGETPTEHRPQRQLPEKRKRVAEEDEEVICEDALLEAFAP